MKRAFFVCLSLCLHTAFLLSQSNPFSLINQSATVVPPISASQADPKAQAKILEGYGKLPLSFEANHGQTDKRVKFLSRTSGYTLFLTGDEAVFTLSGKKADTSKAKIRGAAHTPQPMAAPKAAAVLRMKLRNANPAAKVTGVDELAGTSNYFIGNDPAKWRTNVPTYAKVKYEGIYSGIDLVYYGNQRQLEYDFVVAPGADPHRIQFNVRGAKRIRRDEHGDLVLKVGKGEIRWHKPLVYQEKDGVRQEIAARYAITDTGRVGFMLAKYDASRPLYIDPLIYSTYLGGSGFDFGLGIAVDSTGNAYVMGSTSSRNFPTMNPLQASYGGGDSDAFVTKINPKGSALVYSTYLGGSGNDTNPINVGSYWGGIAVDSMGNAYVTGGTDSIDFPVTPDAFQTTCGGTCYSNAFVTKINPKGSALVYSTYLGGSGSGEGGGYGDSGNSIAVDSAGNAYVTGVTDSIDFPVTPGAFQTTCGGTCDSNAFVTKINPKGSALVYSTYLGGSHYDLGFGIAVDSAGNAYVTGGADAGFPTTPGAFQTTGSGAFVTKINPKGSALVYSTYLDGSLGGSGGHGIAVDRSGNAYVVGATNSTDFPTMHPLQRTCDGCPTYNDAFVAKFNATGSALVYSTYLGGSNSNIGSGIAVDRLGNAYVTGFTDSTDFPTMNPLQATFGGYQDIFVTEINPTGSALVYSTYLGGSESDIGSGIAVDSSGNAYVTGYAASPNFPTMNPLQPALGGLANAFVAKIASPVTFASLIKLVKQFDTKPDVRAIMVFTLELAQWAESVHAAKLADALLDAFIDEVTEQSGKSLTAAQAAILIQDAKALKMPT